MSSTKPAAAGIDLLGRRAIQVLKPTSVIYYTRLIAGIVMGGISTVLYLVDSQGFTQLYLAIAVYLSTYYLLRFVFHIDPTKLRTKNQILTLGIGTYFLMWLLVWVLTFTIFIGPSKLM